MLFVVAAFGLWGMSHYLRGAVEGNWRSNANSFSEAQYEAGKSQEGALSNKIQLVSPKVLVYQNMTTSTNPSSMDWQGDKVATLTMNATKSADGFDGIVMQNIGGDTLLSVNSWGGAARRE